LTNPKKNNNHKATPAKVTILAAGWPILANNGHPLRVLASNTIEGQPDASGTPEALNE
jgi:hypothetical protein